MSFNIYIRRQKRQKIARLDAKYYFCNSIKQKPYMKTNDWKSRLNVVYSTNPDFGYENEEEPEQVTLPPSQQKLRVQLDRKNRGRQGRYTHNRFCGY